MSVNPDKPFWMVYGIDCGPPTVRHDSFEKAEREATRLARQAPGCVFVVLEAVSAVTKRDVIVTRYRSAGAANPRRAPASGDLDDDIPF